MVMSKATQSQTDGITKYFRRIRPEETPPPPPPALALWTSQTLHATVFGALLGGYSGIRDARMHAKMAPSTEGLKNVRHLYATFFVRESITMGARTGVFVAILSAMAIAAEHVRGVRDPWNMSGAAALTCGLFGGAVAGWRAALGSSIFGGATGGLLTLAHEKLHDLTAKYDPSNPDELSAMESASEQKLSLESLADVLSTMEQTRLELAQGLALDDEVTESATCERSK